METEEPLLDTNLSQDTLKSMVTVTDDLLKTLITLSSALLGVGFIFNDFVKTPIMRIFIILLFFGGLIFAFLGVLPFNVRYDIEDAEEYKQQQIKTFRRKRRHVWISAFMMAIGFVLAIVDLIVDLIKSELAILG